MKNTASMMQCRVVWYKFMEV